MEATGRMLRLGEDKAVEAQGHPDQFRFVGLFADSVPFHLTAVAVCDVTIPVQLYPLSNRALSSGCVYVVLVGCPWALR